MFVSLLKYVGRVKLGVHDTMLLDDSDVGFSQFFLIPDVFLHQIISRGFPACSSSITNTKCVTDESVLYRKQRFVDSDITCTVCYLASIARVFFTLSVDSSNKSNL